MITLEEDTLRFRFPNVHERAECSIEFQRTLRIPDDGEVHYLPPGFGRFPLRHLDDYLESLPTAFSERGGVVMPMYQAEALWINFQCNLGYPFAIKIATGKICAISGDSWVNHLNHDPQDYVVVPDQPWLDGYCVGNSVIRQFVAMPLGKGVTVEKQLSGEESIGGLQIAVYPMKEHRFEQLQSKWKDSRILDKDGLKVEAAGEMGLAAGGKMRQQVSPDEHGLDAWDLRLGGRCFVTIANSIQWYGITGERPLNKPITVEDYNRYGLPWFDYYSETGTITGSDKLKGVKGINEIANENGEAPVATGKNTPKKVITLGQESRRLVREYVS